MGYMKAVREAFLERRLGLVLTQAEVAERSHVARKTVSDFENGRASISTATLAKLLATVGLELAVREASRRPTLDELQSRQHAAEPQAPPPPRRARRAKPR